MAKFKVGDKVRVKSWEDICKITKDYLGHRKHSSEVTFTIDMKRKCGELVEIEGVSKCNYGDRYAIKTSDCCYSWYDWMFEDTNTSSIHIYIDGTTTTAILKNGKKTVKKAQAKCSPDDTYDFAIGAKLAFDRLMGIETPTKNKSIAKDCTGMRVKILNVDGFDSNYVELPSYVGKTGKVSGDYGNGFRFVIDFDVNYMNEIDNKNGRLFFMLENVEFI